MLARMLTRMLPPLNDLFASASYFQLLADIKHSNIPVLSWLKG